MKLNRAARRALVSTKHTHDRNVRRISEREYLHVTKGIKPVRKYDIMSEIIAVRRGARG